MLHFDSLPFDFYPRIIDNIFKDREVDFSVCSSIFFCLLNSSFSILKYPSHLFCFFFLFPVSPLFYFLTVTFLFAFLSHFSRTGVIIQHIETMNIPFPEKNKTKQGTWKICSVRGQWEQLDSEINYLRRLQSLHPQILEKSSYATVPKIHFPAILSTQRL